ncbi:MAG: DUF5060 domain-containing protein [Pseudomonadota bacterium]
MGLIGSDLDHVFSGPDTSAEAIETTGSSSVDSFANNSADSSTRKSASQSEQLLPTDPLLGTEEASAVVSAASEYPEDDNSCEQLDIGRVGDGVTAASSSSTDAEEAKPDAFGMVLAAIDSAADEDAAPSNASMQRRGGSDADHLAGGLGDDTLIGNLGNDTLEGHEGHDILRGGLGNDDLYGGDGGDRLNGGDGHDRLKGHAGRDTLSGGDGDDTLKGGKSADRLKGGDGNDRLVGGSGPDNMDGGDGDDILVGGSGADTMAGGAGSDRYRFLEADLDSSTNTVSDFSRGEGDSVDVRNIAVAFGWSESETRDNLALEETGAGVELRITTPGHSQVLAVFSDLDLSDIGFADIMGAADESDAAQHPVEVSMRIEAESMSLENYEEESTSQGSSDAVAKIVSKDVGVGKASTSFDGPTGIYDLTLGFIDESDGEGMVQLMVDGDQVGEWMLDANTNEVVTVTVDDIAIEAGDTVEIVGMSDSGERARIDYLEVAGVGLPGASNSDTDTDTDTDTDSGSEGDLGKTLGTTNVKLYAPEGEWTLANPSISGNPFDLEATVTFTHTATGETLKTGMFYTGDGEYAFRFTGVKTGEWTFETSSSDFDLDGFTGVVNVAPDAKARGFVVSSEAKFAQQIGDGSLDALLPNLVMIDPDLSKYADDPDKIDDLIDVFINQHGFTGFHIPNIGGQFFDLDNTAGEAGSAIGKARTNPDPETFAVLEKIIVATHEAGGIVHFWPWGDSQRGQSPDQLPDGELGDEHLRLLEYIADRLGPIPGWTMGYGFDTNEWTSASKAEDRTEYFEAQTDYEHLLAVRSPGPNDGTDHSFDIEWHKEQGFADFEHHAPTYEVYVAALEASKGLAVQSGDRFRVRGDEGYPDKDYTEAETVDGLWISTMAGGVSNIWGNLTNPSNGEVTRSGNFGSFSYSDETIREISTWNEFMLVQDRFALDAVRANNLTGGTSNGQYALLSEEDSSLIIYAEDTDTVRLNLAALANDVDWLDGAQIIAVDTERAYSEIVLDSVSLTNQTLDLGRTSDWALYLVPDDMM